MLNFKKAGIFSRGSGQEDACEQEEQCGGVLTEFFRDLRMSQDDE